MSASKDIDTEKGIPKFKVLCCSYFTFRNWLPRGICHKLMFSCLDELHV